MKKLLFIVLVLTSCKKSPPSTIDLRITETGGTAPVSNANVSLRRCANLGCAFGMVTEFSGTTNGDGICKVPQDTWNKIPDWNDAILVSKSGYWSEVFSKATSVSVIPAGWVRLHIARAANYPQGSILDFQVSPQINPGGTAMGSSSSYQFHTAADSSVLIMAFGNQSNKIDWRVIAGGNVLNNGTWNQQVPRLDTVLAVLNY